MILKTAPRKSNYEKIASLHALLHFVVCMYQLYQYIVLIDLNRFSGGVYQQSWGQCRTHQVRHFPDISTVVYFSKGNVLDTKEDPYFVNLACHISLRFGTCACFLRPKKKLNNLFPMLYSHLRKILFVNVDSKNILFRHLIAWSREHKGFGEGWMVISILRLY